MKRWRWLRRWRMHRRLLRWGMSGGATDRVSYYNPSHAHGAEAGESIPIDAETGGDGKRRLLVKSEVSGVAEINLDETNDEVAVFGGIDGSETATAAVRQIINVDSVGRVRTDSTLQIADADVPGGSGVATASTPRVTIATDDVVSVDDNGGSLTVDNPTLSVTGAGAEATAQRVTIATESLSALESITVQNGAGAAAVNIQDGGNSITVDGTVSATQGTTPWTVAGNVAHDGVDSGNPVKVGGHARADAVTPPTAVATDDRVDAWFDLNGRQVVAAVGAQAHDDANDVDNRPLKIGAVAAAHGANPTAVAAADIVQLLANRAGIQFVIGGHPNIRSTEYTWTTAQTNDDILGAIAAGTKVVVTGIAMTLDEATTVGVKVRVGFGAASVPAEPADGASVEGVILSHVGVVPGGGIIRGDGSGIIGTGADGEELRITAEVPTTGTGKLIVTWYTVES